MKKTTLAIISIASVAGLAGIANAVPFGLPDTSQGNGFIISQLAREGAGGPNSSSFGTFVSQSVGNGTINGIQSASVVNQTLPLPTALTLLGVGIAAWGLAGWLRRLKSHTNP